MCYSVVSLLTQSTEVPSSVPQEQVTTSATVDSYNYSVTYSPAATSSGYSSYTHTPNGSPEHSPTSDPLLDIDLALTPSPENPFGMADSCGSSPYPDSQSFVGSPEYCHQSYMDDPMYPTVMTDPNPCFPQFTAGLENALDSKNFGMVRGSNFFFSNYPQSVEMARLFKQCKICGDVASGNHFGVQSCEACKSFFRRSIRSNSRYACRGSRTCTIEKHTRNRCQYCRLQKCISHGMRKEAVQEERNPFAAKEQLATGSLDNMTVSNDKGMHFKIEKFDCSPDSTVSDAVLLNADKSFQSNETVMNMSPTVKSKDSHFEGLKTSLLKVIDWAKRIPAFVSLSREDQMILLNSCWHQIFVFMHASQPKANSAELTSWFNNLGADKVEQACLKGLVLFNQDAKGLSLSSKKRVEAFQEQILQSLATRTKTVYGGSPMRFSKLLLRLGSLKSISVEAVRHMNVQAALGNKKMTTLLGELL